MKVRIKDVLSKTSEKQQETDWCGWSRVSWGVGKELEPYDVGPVRPWSGVRTYFKCDETSWVGYSRAGDVGVRLIWFTSFKDSLVVIRSREEVRGHCSSPRESNMGFIQGSSRVYGDDMDLFCILEVEPIGMTGD